MSVKISVTGNKEIDRILAEMPKVVQHQALGAAHLDAAKPMIEREKSLVPRRTGELQNSIGGIKTPMKRAGAVGEVIIGPRRSRKNRGHHGVLVEKGTKKRQTRKGANRGVMPAQPFVEPAFTGTKDTVIGRIAVSVGRKMLSVMRRYAKK